MSHQLYDVTAFEAVKPYTLRVQFSDNTQQVVDFEPVLYGEMYSPLRDPNLFSQVRLDADIKTLVWPNGADFDPYVLHEWPRIVEQLSRRLRSASMVATSL
jgi:hypothetical protein